MLDDEYKARVKGDMALEILMDRLTQLNTANVRHLLERCSTAPAAVAFCGYVFRRFAVRCISHNDSNTAPFHLLAHMPQSLQPIGDTFPMQFTYKPSMVGRTHLQGPPGLRSRRMTRWMEAGIGRLDDEKLYVSTESNNAPFDSFS